MSVHPFGTGLYYFVENDWSELGELRLVNPVSRSREKYKSVPKNMVEDWIQYFPGLKDGGTIDFVLIYSQAVFVILTTLFNRYPHDDLDHYQVRLPLLTNQTTPTIIEVDGFLESKDFNDGTYNATDPYTVAGSVQVSGKPRIVLAT